MVEPGYLEKALKSIRTYILSWFLVSGLFLVGVYFILQYFFVLQPLAVAGILAAVWIVPGATIGAIVAKEVSRPLEALSQAILHVSPSPIPIPAPDFEKLTLAKELIETLSRQVYDYASKSGGLEPASRSAAEINIQQLPVGVLGVDTDGNIIFANQKAREYANASIEIIGKNLYSLFDILFRGQTLQDWLRECENNAVTAQKVWRGIRFNPYGEHIQYFDMAVHFSKSSVAGQSQAIIALFDQNEVYGAEEKGLSFIALAVHELRTPLTILRGYIEVFEDEVKDGSLRPELAEDVKKMQVSSENLTAFVNNILNVAKIEENQLTLKLHQENWPETLSKIIENLRLRGEVHGKKIELNVEANLPPVGVDTISIAEVITNLVDNAIKYSPPDKTLIKVSSHLTKDGLVETVVQDFGVGVPTQVMPHLFEKFSRNYRNKNNIIGSGLGLYLSKALVNAHGGNIWVRSQEGQGSEFGFTIIPFAQLSEEEKNGVNKEITRSAHGWIKNHSLSRR
ncbi:PAS domain-containing sensor histidine kinase [Candidatus Parcubacteria bacterium]|nr:PAS domain-containing sensor histidine kinase [Candidatus Parcubacteria bacterium]